MKRTMTPAEEAEWLDSIRAGKGVVRDPTPAAHQTKRRIIAPAPTRRRAYTVDELEELWAEWSSQNPNHRDGFEFLMWVRRR